MIPLLTILLFYIVNNTKYHYVTLPTVRTKFCAPTIYLPHPAADVTRVFVVPGKGSEKGGCRDKHRLNKAKYRVHLVLSRVPFKSGA